MSNSESTLMMELNIFICFIVRVVSKQWKGINRKQSTRWQHLSQLKASTFFSLQKNLVVIKHSNLYLGHVLPSGGWQSLIGFITGDTKVNIQTLQLFTKMTKKERIFKGNFKAKQGLGAKPRGIRKRGGKCKCFLREVTLI
jgi:hypothetical protein